MDPALEEDGIEIAAGEAQPIPDSRRIEDFIGSGERERRRSCRGIGLRVAIG
jgi:hypothetical protein